MVMCGDIPLHDRTRLAKCCSDNKPLPPTAAALMAATEQQRQAQTAEEVQRPDLNPGSGTYSAPLNWHYNDCVPQKLAEVPFFHKDDNGETQAEIVAQPVPELDAGLIRRVKDRALRSAPRTQRMQMAILQAKADATRGKAARSSGFVHPGGYAGPAELAALQWRLTNGDPLQTAAKESLLTVRFFCVSGGVIALGASGWLKRSQASLISGGTAEPPPRSCLHTNDRVGGCPATSSPRLGGTRQWTCQ